jgi:hypothetical protein
MSDNPYFKRLAAQAAGAHGGKSEARVAKALGARLQPGSGAMTGAKSDSRIKAKVSYRIESKSTIKDTLPLDVGWLTKITHEALSDGSIPALSLSFVKADGTPRMPRNAEWVAIPLWAFQELIEKNE